MTVRNSATLVTSGAIAISMLLTAIASDAWWIRFPAIILGVSAVVMGGLELRKPSDHHGPPGQS